MKIGIVLHRFTQGGIERVVYRLLPQFANADGFEVVLFSEEGKDKDVYDDVPEHRRVVVGSDEGRSERFYKALEIEKIDVCIVEDYWFPHFVDDCEVLNKCAVPYIVHIHNVFSEFFMRPELWRDKAKWYAAFASSRAVIVLSRHDEYFFRLLGCNAHYFVNPVADVPPEFRKDEVPFNILWVARFDEQKRPEDALKIFNCVLNRIPCAKLTFVGDFNTAIGRNVKSRVLSDSRLAKSVVFAGFQSDVWEWYSRASVFLSTAAFEGFPLTFMEAAAAGVPIVGYDLPYLESTRGNAGFIPVKMGDIDGAADAICRLLEDDEARAKAGAANRATFERMKSFDQMAAYRKLFEDVKAGVRAGPPEGDETAQVCLRTLAEHATLGIAGLKDIIRRDWAGIKRLKRAKRRKNQIIIVMAVAGIWFVLAVVLLIIP